MEAVIGAAEAPEEPASVSGLTDGAAEGIEGVTVEACNEEEREEKDPHFVCHNTQSGAGGHYSITNVPPGFYVLIATPAAHSGYASTATEEIALLPDEAASQNIQLRGSGSVGTVSSEAGPPLAGVSVSMCEESEFGQCFTITTESQVDTPSPTSGGQLPGHGHPAHQ